MSSDAEMEEWIRALDQSELFDHQYYGEHSGRSHPDRHEAIKHYLTTGWTKGYNPSVLFDTAFYLATNPDVRESGLPPLIHFVNHGRREGRRAKLTATRLAKKPVAPDSAVWQGLASAKRDSMQSEPVLDVVIPVYRSYDDTLACIYSVLLSRNETPFELIIINDKSPDPNLSQALNDIAALGLITVINNEENIGFVRTANIGLFLHASRDVLLLNSDTVVYGDWVDRMRYHAGAHTRVATVTAMSNNATILSYPRCIDNNNCELELDFPDLDKLFAETLAQRSVEIPTGIGFCFYVTRKSLDQIGGFDVDLFGRGYGEENDLCMRAADSGWLNLAALDVFVRHTGEVSFSESALEGKSKGLQALVNRWPHYTHLIETYIKTDPIAAARAEIDVARVARFNDGPVLLFIEHGWGGGTERHMSDLAQLCGREHVTVIRAKPSAENRRWLELVPYATQDYDFPNLPKLPLDDIAAASDLLKRCGVSHIHIHSLVSYDLSDVRNLTEIVDQIGAEFNYTVHDYTSICPRITMADWGGAYCASPNEEYCTVCIDRDGTPFGQVDIREWRDSYLHLLEKARRVIVPDADVQQRMARYRPEIATTLLVRPHFENQKADVTQQRHLWRKAKSEGHAKRIGIIGAIGPHKGSRVLLATAAAALSERLPLEFVLYGFSDIDDELRALPNVRIKGRYEEGQISSILRDDPCDMAFYPSIWPETYCYSLSIAFLNSIFPVSFDIGAPARRIADFQFGAVIPLELAFNAHALAAKLLDLQPQSPPFNFFQRMKLASDWRSYDYYYDRPA